MEITLKSVVEHPIRGLQFLELFMENFEEIIFRAEDILFVEMKGAREAFSGLTPSSQFKEFFKAYDGLRIAIKNDANQMDRFKNPEFHDSTPFEYLSTYSDIVALTFCYNIELDIPEIIQYADDKKTITVYVPYREAEWDRHQSVLQRTMKNDDGSLTVEFVKETAQ